MPNRIKEIQNNFSKLDALIEKILCDYSGHWEECPHYGNPQAYEKVLCRCGWDRTLDELADAAKILRNSIK